ncbi:MULTISPECIES: hypothetical protein [Kitasatospora]|nr:MULTISPECIES: hypothetical protein [Kitasatospora]
MSKKRLSTARNLARTALFSGVRGIAYGTGSVLAGLLVWLVKSTF